MTSTKSGRNQKEKVPNMEPEKLEDLWGLDLLMTDEAKRKYFLSFSTAKN